MVAGKRTLLMCLICSWVCLQGTEARAVPPSEIWAPSARDQIGAAVMASEVVQRAGGDENTLAYLSRTPRAYYFRFQLGPRQMLLKVAADGYGALMPREVAATQFASESGWGPKFVQVADVGGVLLTERIQGEALEAEQLRDEAILAKVLAKAALVHSYPCAGVEDPALELIRDARLLQETLEVPNVPGALDPALIEASIGQLEAVTKKLKPHLGLCHNRLWPENIFLDENQNVVFVDWSELGCGDPLIEVAKLALAAQLPPEQGPQLLQMYLNRQPSAEETLRFEAVMGVLEVVGYDASDVRED